LRVGDLPSILPPPFFDQIQHPREAWMPSMEVSGATPGRPRPMRELLA
jgi:hypothetical protein